MNERELRRLIGAVKTWKAVATSLRAAVLAVGLTAPMATQLLAIAGVAHAQPKSQYKPTKRGGGGLLKVLWWQGPTLLNPHFAVGTKDQDGSRVFYEPLAAWDGDGNLKPKLAASIPGREDGTLAADGKSVVWKLKQGVTWHDGKPFTADDVVFNWEYAKDPATAATTAASYNEVMVEKVDQYSVMVKFAKPTPFWADAFVGTRGMMIPKHLFADYMGGKSREAPTNLKPVGTGPYMFKDFKPGDLVAGVINPNYHQDNKPYFDAIEMKGGGDAVSAARAVLQSGEYDFGWNMQVEDEILARLEKGGKGKVIVSPGGNIEHIQLNFTDPWTEVDGERCEPQDQASDAQRSRRCARPSRCWSTRIRSRSTSTAAPARPRRTSSTTRSASSPRRPSSSSTSTRPTRSSRRPAGRRAPTASARRTARSSSSSTRPRSTSRARRPRRSSSRPPRRPASTSS